MRRAEFRPRPFAKSRYGIALATRLTEAPVIEDEADGIPVTAPKPKPPHPKHARVDLADDEPVDPDKPLPGQPVPGPQEPPDPKPQDPPAKAAPKQRRVK